jgi:hypothetical protein
VSGLTGAAAAAGRGRRFLIVENEIEAVILLVLGEVDRCSTQDIHRRLVDENPDIADLDDDILFLRFRLGGSGLLRSRQSAHEVKAPDVTPRGANAALAQDSAAFLFVS